jgi:5-(carboxyamino)imidazole ribonucleotide mutase
MSGKVVFVMGSEVDMPHAQKIQAKLDELDVAYDTHVSSAHKMAAKALGILESYENESKIIYITIAGRSNALSGFTAGHTKHPVIACPPFQDKMDMWVNIHSTLQMPSKVPVMTVLDPANAAEAAWRILR